MAAIPAVQRITRKMSEERASNLAKEAVEVFKTGNQEQASRKLREAAALDHGNIDVQAAFLALHGDSTTSPLLDLCRRYAFYHDEKAGDSAVNLLRVTGVSPTEPVALQSLAVILEGKQSSLSSAQDTIIAELARQSLVVRQYFVSQLSASTTEFFDNVYERGDDSANVLRSVVLTTSLWSNDDERLRVEDDLFQLFLAKLMETGHDNDGRALKGIALLLIADTQRLHSFVDEEAFDALLCSLDLRLPSNVRGQATLVLSKYLEVAEQNGYDYFTRFIHSHVAKQKGDDLILAFSAAANLFPVATSATAQLFLSQGFLQSIMPLLEQRFNTTMIHDSFLTLLNAACIDGSCRKAISQICAPWLSHKVSNGKGKQPSMAATILAKLRTSGSNSGDQRANKADDDVSELVDLFKNTLRVEEGRNVSDSIEGLAYTSLKSEIKEKLSKDQSFLKSLLQALDSNPNVPEIVVGGLSIIANLTQYPPNQSEEQKKISQLKAYASASKPIEPSPLENEEHVRDRCSAVVNAGVLTTLTKLNKTGSPSTIQLTDKIMLSLSKNSKERGRIAQQGAIKLLITHANNQLKALDKNSSTDAAHALARILISLNPDLVFQQGSTPHITDAIPPLVILIKTPSSEGLRDQPRDLLPVFESLLALTNLASSSDEVAATAIIRVAWDDIEDLLLGKNDMVRRAACELVCNLTALPSGAAKFVDGTRKAAQRLHLLVAMADVDDLPTRRAAGGALAMLSDHSAAIPALLDLRRAPEILLELCEDEDEGIVHRGLVVILNLLTVEGDSALSTRARTLFKEHGAVEKLKECLKKTRNPELLQVGIEALKALVQ